MPQPRIAIAIHDDNVWLPSIDISFSGISQTILTTPGNAQATYIWRIVVMVSAATNLTFLDAGRILMGPMSFAANEAMVLTFDTKPWFTCETSFVIGNSGGIQVGGAAYYTQQ
jgi:hypothetical protein